MGKSIGKAFKKAKNLTKGVGNATLGVVTADASRIKKGVTTAVGVAAGDLLPGGASPSIAAAEEKPLTSEVSNLTSELDQAKAENDFNSRLRKGRRRSRTSVITSASGLVDKAKTAGKTLLGT